MTLHVFSMTGTLIALIENKIKLEDLVDAEFHFGCQKLHIVRDDNLVPYEATWKNRDRKTSNSSNGYELPIELVDENNRAVVLAFVKLIREADTCNKVQWAVHYRSILDTLPNDDLVMEHGVKRRVGDIL